jgi:WD40 repeat protein
LPVSEFTDDKIEWVGGENLAGDIETDREMPEMELNKQDPEETIDKIQSQFRQSKMMMSMMLGGFYMKATYHLPYKIKSITNLEQEDDFTVVQTLSGEKIFSNYEKLIEDEEKLKKLIEEENLSKFSLENPKLFKAAYPKGAMYSANFRTGLFSPSPKTYFNYEKEVSSIKNKIPELKIPEKPKPPKPKVFIGKPKNFHTHWKIHTSHYSAALRENKLALYSSSNNKQSIQIFDIPTRKKTKEIFFQETSVYGVFLRWSPDGKKIAFTGQMSNNKNKGIVRIFDSKEKDLIAEKYFKAQPSDFVWVDNTTFAISYTNHEFNFGKIQGDTLASGKTFRFSDEKMVQGAINPSKLSVLKSGEKEGEKHVLSFDHSSGSLKIWDPFKEKLLRTVTIEEPGIPRDMEASPNPKYIALLLDNRIVTFVNGKIYKEINDIAQPLYQISWSPDGKYLTYINNKKELVYYDITKGQKEFVAHPDSNPEILFRLTPTGQYGITTLEDNYAKYSVIKFEY